MDKLGLVVCIEDEEYRKRLLQCVMNHYKGQFEFFVYTSLKEMKKNSLEEHQGMLLGDVARSEISDFINQGEKIIFLKENAKEDMDDMMPANLVFVEKYQEVYKITDEIQKLAGVREKNGVGRLESKYKVFGVYSLDACSLQTPFAATLAAVLGERKKCLLIDVQPFSGLGILEENAWGMEDLMSVALTGVYTKSRLLEGICHQENWDYLQPVKNTERVAEGSRDIYRNMMNILSREFGYEIFIFNFGSIYESVF